MAINVDPNAYVHSSVIMEGNITIGEYTRVGAGTVLLGNVTIGHHCVIECNVVIRGNNTIGNWVHIYDLVNIEGGRPGNQIGGNVNKEADQSIIGNGCWINHGATMHGSQMGDGAVLDLNACLDYNSRLGKGALVTNGSAVHYDTAVPENCMVEGVPAKVIKENITDDDRVERMGLLPAAWVKYAGEQTEARIRNGELK
jgi:carbonic anhydrase/acetyltransferase-like protein (isoleucine patch superfamily)